MTRWLVLMAGLAGCVPDGGAPAGDDAALERARPDVYYTVASDDRDCAWPMCGGYFLTAVNRPVTRCADGTVADSCYVAQLDTRGLFASNAQEAAFWAQVGAGTALLRGDATVQAVLGFDLGVLSVDEAWAGMTGSQPSGRFVRLTETGMLCLAYPCANIAEDPLNRSAHRMIAEVDYTPSGATPDEIAKAVDAMATPDGLIVAGRRYQVTGPAGTAPARTATELWTLIAAR